MRVCQECWSHHERFEPHRHRSRRRCATGRRGRSSARIAFRAHLAGLLANDHQSLGRFHLLQVGDRRFRQRRRCHRYCSAYSVGLGYVGGWFGPDTVDIIHEKIISFSNRTFSANVVEEIISPTVTDVLQRGRVGIVSVGFILSLWAGSSAMSTFVDSIVDAHGQQDARNPLWQRIFALLLYIQFLIASVFILPLVALGPARISAGLPEIGVRSAPDCWISSTTPASALLIVGLTTLYKLALHKSLPWHRLLFGALVAGVFFMGPVPHRGATSVGRRSPGSVNGALATPIAFCFSRSSSASRSSWARNSMRRSKSSRAYQTDPHGAGVAANQSRRGPCDDRPGQPCQTAGDRSDPSRDQGGRVG